MSVRRLVASLIPHAVQSLRGLCPLRVLGTSTLSQGLSPCPGPALTDLIPSLGTGCGASTRGLLPGSSPQLRADSCAPTRLSGAFSGLPSRP